MSLVEITKIHTLLNEKVTQDLILKSWAINKVHPEIHEFNLIGLEHLIAAFCLQKNWNLDTTLVIYQMPYDNPTGDLDLAREKSNSNNSLYKTNYNMCICSIFPNMTLDKFVQQINQIAKMKAFL